MKCLVLTLCVFVCAHVKGRNSECKPEHRIHLSFIQAWWHSCSRAWSSPHDLRRVLPTTRDDLVAFSAQTGSCRRARGCMLAAAQPWMYRRGDEVPGWAEARGLFLLDRKNKSKFRYRAGQEFSARKRDFYRIRSFHGKLALSTEEFRCFHWEKWNEMMWNNWPWSELFPLSKRPEPVHVKLFPCRNGNVCCERWLLHREE